MNFQKFTTKSPTDALKAIIVVTVLPAIFLVIFTNPAEAGPVVVVVWFILVYLAISTLISLRLYTRYGARYDLLRSLRVGFIVASLPVAILGLYSISQLQPQDVLLLLLLFLSVGWYLYKMHTP